MKRHYPTVPIAAVSGVVVGEEGRILLAKRGNSPSKGKWSLPGGVVHVGEELEDALKREVLEETGIHVIVDRLLDVSSRILRDEEGPVRYHYILLDYLCRAKDTKATAASDADEVRWVKVDEITDFDLTEGVKEVVLKGIEALRHHRHQR